MAYTVNIQASVTDEDGNDVASVGRNYDIAELSKVAAAVSNAGDCLSLLCAGVDAGLTDTHDRP